MPKPKPGEATKAQVQPYADVLDDLQPLRSQTRRQQRPARCSSAVTDAAATTFMAERTAAEAQRASFHHQNKTRIQGRQATPSRTGAKQGPTSSVLTVCLHAADAPLPPPSRIANQTRSGVRVRVPTVQRTLPPPLPTHSQGTGLGGLSQPCHRHQSP